MAGGSRFAASTSHSQALGTVSCAPRRRARLRYARSRARERRRRRLLLGVASSASPRLRVSAVDDFVVAVPLVLAFLRDPLSPLRLCVDVSAVRTCPPRETTATSSGARSR